MNSIAWSVEQHLYRNDLPHRVVIEMTPARAAVYAVLDRIWRTRAELARLSGLSIWTVNRVVDALVKQGLVECLPGGSGRPHQYRRVR